MRAVALVALLLRQAFFASGAAGAAPHGHPTADLATMTRTPPPPEPDAPEAVASAWPEDPYADSHGSPWNASSPAGAGYSLGNHRGPRTILALWLLAD